MFLPYINDLSRTIKLCKVHHFSDGINLLYLDKSIKHLNKLVNIGLRSLVNWLNYLVNYLTASVKYLDVKTDQHLTCQHHINDISVKLNRANARLFKIRKIFDDKI